MAAWSVAGGAPAARRTTLSARWDFVAEVPRSAAEPERPDLPLRVTVELPPEMEEEPPPVVEWSSPGGRCDEGPPVPDEPGIVSVASAFGGLRNVRFGPGRRDSDGRGTDAGGPPAVAPAWIPPAPCFEPQPVAPESARARLVAAVPPDYPESARVHGVEGVVLLDVEVLADGAVGEVTVVRSSGSRALDRAAVAAARVWTYSAGIEAGVPVRSVLRVPPVRFRLE